jgi:signal transduction histidine kinase
MGMMFRSIRWRLVFSYVFLIILTLGMVGAAILRLVADYVERQEMEYLTANAEAVASQAASLLWPVVRQAELQELAQTSSLLGNAQVRILDGSQRVLADSESAGARDVAWILVPHEWQLVVPEGFLDPLEISLPRGRRLVLPASVEEQLRLVQQLPPEVALTLLRWQDRLWGGGFEFDVIKGPEQLEDLVAGSQAVPRSDRVLTTPIDEAGAPLGYVEISRGPDLVGEAVATTRQAFTYAALGAMCLAVVVGLVVSRGVAAPLRELTRVAGEMSGGDLSSRAPVRSRDEIGQLAGQFNQMAARLEASFDELAAERDALRRFIADASHELRTPITALKSFNDLVRGAAAEDPAARAEFLAESQLQLDRLEWVTSHLLDLSRLDAGLVELDLADHDVGDMIEAATSAFRARAQEKGIDLAILLPVPPLELRCDRARMELALSNLLANAIKFTAAGGRVEIGAERVGDVIRVWVRDSGPGINPGDLPHIFERFYRGRGAHGEGSGLGLAIVQGIVHAHGGQISVDTEPEAGSCFRVELPCTTPL